MVVLEVDVCGWVVVVLRDGGDIVVVLGGSGDRDSRSDHLPLYIKPSPVTRTPAQ